PFTHEAPLMVSEGDILWQASPARLQASMAGQFLAWLAARGQLFDGYTDLHSWSVSDPAAFWLALRDFFGIEMEGDLQEVLTDDPMPRARWFTGTRLNYAEQVLRHE